MNLIRENSYNALNWIKDHSVLFWSWMGTGASIIVGFIGTYAMFFSGMAAIVTISYTIYNWYEKIKQKHEKERSYETE